MSRAANTSDPRALARVDGSVFESSAERVLPSGPASTGLTRLRAACKRVIDVVVASSLVILVTPPMIAVVLVMLVTDPGPILFRQVRVGRDRQPFRVIKLRTMVVDAEARLRSDELLYRTYVANGHKLSQEEDPRLTRLGRFLRKTSLDEVPQLLNVIGGSMSLVGPRPVLYEELDNYRHLEDTVTSVRPGMTGLWQVSGRSDIGFPERAYLDADYVTRLSVRRDVLIMFKTVGAVLRRDGAV